MLTALGFAIGFVIAVVAFLAIAMRHDRTLNAEQQRVIRQFQDILNHRLEEYEPRIRVWLANKDARCRPYASIAAHGHIFTTRASGTEEMRAEADKAADFFSKKKLMKWINFD